ncbi:hypothetical protein PoB_003319600 [Plakobranchus ocellatus]|uniref:Uncharacterized protein n=1 Tax=Plakobranchus ocellatus TaxID=259542 RepID=A0AAV4AJ92_9GAST|nr:hypothetical protein PoB_003319600 [Plakobranchus ocellatus]
MNRSGRHEYSVLIQPPPNKQQLFLRWPRLNSWCARGKCAATNFNFRLKKASLSPNKASNLFSRPSTLICPIAYPCQRLHRQCLSVSLEDISQLFWRGMFQLRCEEMATFYFALPQSVYVILKNITC